MGKDQVTPVPGSIAAVTQFKRPGSVHIYEDFWTPSKGKFGSFNHHASRIESLHSREQKKMIEGN